MIILGAGITGISAAIKTKAPIYEETQQAGGICRTYRIKDFMFEKGGGHWIFGADDIRKFLNKYGDFIEYKKNAGILFDTIINGSIQNMKTHYPKDNTMKHWLKNRFGNDLCNLFFYPFNENYTSGLYESIIQDDPDKSPIKYSKEYNETFIYPEKGLASVIDNMTKNLTIHYNKKAIRIQNKRIFFEDGSSVKYDKIISTLPLDVMLDMVGYTGYKLPYTSTMVMNIGAVAGDVPKEQWLYVPYDKCYRIGFYSNVSKLFAKNDDVSIYCESSYIDKQGAAPRNIISTLLKHKFVQYVYTFDYSFIKRAYTWLYEDSKREDYIEYLKELGIHQIGRYGKWKFQGIAESIRDGLGIQ